MSQLLDLKKKYADGDVVFIGVNAGDSDRAAQKFVDRMNYSYQILLDKDKNVSKDFAVVGLPQTLVINKEGKIIFRGSRPPKDISINLASQ
jgi:peroxiredoxin